MTEIKQKYELLTLFPLITTEEELQKQANKIEERLKVAGVSIHASTPLTKGKLAYEIGKIRQGYYHIIQFESEPSILADFRRNLQFSGETIRFSILKIDGEFKVFVPTQPETRKQSLTQRKATYTTDTVQIIKDGEIEVQKPAAEEKLTQERISPLSKTKISMEEIDKKLEEILEG